MRLLTNTGLPNGSLQEVNRGKVDTNARNTSVHGLCREKGANKL